MYEIFNNEALICTLYNQPDSVYAMLSTILQYPAKLSDIKLVEYIQLPIQHSPILENKRITGIYYYNSKTCCFEDSTLYKYISIPTTDEYRYLVIQIKKKLSKIKFQKNKNKKKKKKKKTKSTFFDNQSNKEHNESLFKMSENIDEKKDEIPTTDNNKSFVDLVLDSKSSSIWK